jgi:ferric-dicitrate binding protein FerR (iron transport regulator)
MRTPSVIDYRCRAERRDRWHTALAMALVAALAWLVFWLLPLPAASKTSPVPPTPTEKEHRP